MFYHKAVGIAALFLAAATLSGCSTLEQILRGAAHERGIAEARVMMPDPPAECTTEVPHAPLVVGTEIRSILKRERGQTNKANASKLRCTDFYLDVRDRLK